MPCYLGHYEGTFGKAATNRVEKFHRAVESVIAQSFDQWELIVVADGCDITWAEKDRYLNSNKLLRFYKIPRQRQWSPDVRNFGLTKVNGLYVIYLDSDDRYGVAHLQNVHDGLRAAEMPMWGALDDLVWEPGRDVWSRRLVTDLIERKRAGTSNIVHKPGLRYWPPIQYRHPDFGYAREDRAFVDELSELGPPAIITGSEYYVCHTPNLYDL